MKERPILFSGPMVREILEGRKTQTRRVAKLTEAGRVKAIGLPRNWHPEDPNAMLACPYGVPGDRLWVRENGWERPERTPRMMREGADTWDPYYYDVDGLTESDVDDFKRWGFKRRPSIHMPRWASRLTLEIEAVRLERLQEIDADDAEKEGVGCGVNDESGGPVARFKTLWESINGPGSWDANPWVWVIQFKRIEKGTK